MDIEGGDGGGDGVVDVERKVGPRVVDPDPVEPPEFGDDRNMS